MPDPGGPAPRIESTCISCHVPAQPLLSLLPARKIADLQATVLLLLHRPDQGQDPDQGGLCAGVVLLACKTSCFSPAAGALGLTTLAGVGVAAQTTPSADGLSTLPPWRPLLAGAREREGRLSAARWLQLASVAVDGTPRVRTPVLPWLGRWRGPGSAHATVAVPNLEVSGSQPWNSVGLLPKAPVLSSVWRGQVLALPA